MLLDDAKIRRLFNEKPHIAIVGAKDKPGQPVDRVGRYLLERGFDISPVHPARHSVWGLDAYPTLADVPRPPRIVVLFRAAEYCVEHARECLELKEKPLAFWMQSGIRNAEAARLMGEAGVMVVQDACIMVEHKRLMGSDSESGF